MTAVLHKPILIAENDLDDIDFIITALEKAGYNGTITSFPDGSKLFKYLEENPGALPAVIILDLNMPVLNGFETLKTIKKHDVHSNIPVLIYTSSDHVGAGRRSHDMGCSGFFPKPVHVQGFEEFAHKVITYV
jgi:CheY-like chemotaxis protein